MERGEVYVVADAAGLVKVGYSHYAKRRIWCICSASKPIRTITIRQFDNRMARSVEKLAHQILGIPAWVPSGNGEWFAVSKKQAVRAINIASRRVRRYRREIGGIEKSWRDIWQWSIKCNLP